MKNIKDTKKEYINTLNTLRHIEWYSIMKQKSGQPLLTLDEVVSLILDMPNDDVAEVVRCINCKYWKSGEEAVASHGFGNDIGECHCPKWGNDYFYYLTNDTDFCSCGDRGESYGN